MIQKPNEKHGKHKSNVIIFVAILILSFFLVGCSGKISLISETYLCAQGSEMPSEISSYMKGNSEELSKCVVDVSGVDTRAVGVYEMTITHPDKTYVITVEVKDMKGPQIELFSDEVFGEPGVPIDLYEVLKSAKDDTTFEVGFADDITKADSDKILSANVTYENTGLYNSEICGRDSYGNMTVVPIIINIKTDDTAPVISGIDDKVYTLVGQERDYSSDIIIIDDKDGNISFKAEIDDSQVNYYIAGEYLMVISVTDSNDNTATKVVTVVVQTEEQSLADSQNSGSESGQGGDEVTQAPTEAPTQAPTETPTQAPTEAPTQAPTEAPTQPPTEAPTQPPTEAPTQNQYAEFDKYSTDEVPFGVSDELDPVTNRPTDLLWYVNKFSSYAVDFIKPDGQNVYLTYDVPYENGYTKGILDILSQKGVKAVFFITLNYAKNNPDLVQRMINEGHVLGNYTSSNSQISLSYFPVANQINEIMNLHNYIKDNFGYEMYLFRFPMGSFSEQNLAVVESLGYRSVFWSCAYKDWITDEQPDVYATLDKILSKAHGGAIFQFNVVSRTNLAMLADFIDGCTEKGYVFSYYSK